MTDNIFIEIGSAQEEATPQAGDNLETENQELNWRADPLAVWRGIAPNKLLDLYMNDPIIRQSIDLQIGRKKHPEVQATPPSEPILGYTEDGKIYAKRAARTDAERMEMMAAIRKAYDG